MISHPHKFVFIHIPKTGGSSIETLFLGKPQRRWAPEINHYFQHATAAELRNRLMNRDNFDRYFKFAFVRNPWDRIVSEMKWRYGRTFESGKITIRDFLIQ